MVDIVTKEERREWHRLAKTGAMSERSVRLLATVDAMEDERNVLAWVLGKRNPPCIDEKWHCPTETSNCNAIKNVKRITMCWLHWAEDRRLKGATIDFTQRELPG